jgi:hypothetical protein
MLAMLERPGDARYTLNILNIPTIPFPYTSKKPRQSPVQPYLAQQAVEPSVTAQAT